MLNLVVLGMQIGSFLGGASEARLVAEEEEKEVAVVGMLVVSSIDGPLSFGALGMLCNDFWGNSLGKINWLQTYWPNDQPIL